LFEKCAQTAYNSLYTFIANTATLYYEKLHSLTVTKLIIWHKFLPFFIGSFQTVLE